MIGKVIEIENEIYKIESNNIIYIAIKVKSKLDINDLISFIPSSLMLGGKEVLIADNIKKINSNTLKKVQ